jgi:hypothetical protein
MWRHLSVFEVDSFQEDCLFLTQESFSHIAKHSTMLTIFQIDMNTSSELFNDFAILLKNNHKTLRKIHLQIEISSFKTLCQELISYCNASDIYLVVSCGEHFIELDDVLSFIMHNINSQRIAIFDHPFACRSKGFELNNLDNYAVLNLINVSSSNLLLVNLIRSVNKLTYCLFTRVKGVDTQVIESIIRYHSKSLKRLQMLNCGSSYTLMDILNICDSCPLLKILEISLCDENLITKESFDSYLKIISPRYIRFILREKDVNHFSEWIYHVFD